MLGEFVTVEELLLPERVIDAEVVTVASTAIDVGLLSPTMVTEKCEVLELEAVGSWVNII